MSWGEIKKAVNSDLTTPLNKRLGWVSDGNGELYAPVMKRMYLSDGDMEIPSYSEAIAIDDEFIYCGLGNKVLVKIRKTDSSIIGMSALLPDISRSIAVDDNFIYYSTYTTAVIIKIDKNNLEVVATSNTVFSFINSIVVDEEFVYCGRSTNTNGEIIKMRKSDLSVVATSAAGGAYAITIDDNYIYSNNPSNSANNPNKIVKMNKEDLKIVATSVVEIENMPSIVVDENFVYCIDEKNRRVWKLYKRDLTTRIGSAIHTGSSRSLIVDGDSILYPFDSGNKVIVMSRFFLLVVDEIKTSGRVLSAAADSNNIYFAFAGSGSVGKMLKGFSVDGYQKAGDSK